jgi:hypothetical protein
MIVIFPTVFDLFPQYSRWQVRLHATLADGTEGASYTTLVSNSPPTGGTCSISPLAGDAVNTLFDITCTGWTDDDGVDEYQILGKMYLN